MTSRPADSAQRRAAVTIFDRNVVVVAGAGTGKTALLSARALVYLLGESHRCRVACTPDQRAREVLALTFTEKAAAEMAERLVHFLGTLSGFREVEGLDDQVRELVVEPLMETYGLSADTIRTRAASMLEQVELVEASTIHSFCSSLLLRHPFEAGISPDFEVDRDGTRLNELLDRVWIEYVHAQLADAEHVPAAWRIAFDAGMGLRALRDAARALIVSNVPTGWLLDPAVLVGDADVHACRLRSALPRLAELAQTIEALRVPGNVRLSRLGRALLAMARALSVHERVPPDVEEAWRRLIKDGVDGLFVATVLKRIEQAGIDEQRVRTELERAVELVEEARAFTPVELAAVHEICAPVVREVRERALREGIVGFDHLLLYAASLVAASPAIAAALRERYRCVLLDEVQDTDPLQYDIIKPLREDGSGASWGTRGTFMVGDPKQSIYLFREADIQAFHREATDLGGTGATVIIAANFRSDPRIIAVGNALSRRLFREGGHPPQIQPCYDPLCAHLPTKGTQPPVEVVRVSVDAEKVRMGDRAEAENAAAVEWIRKFHGEGYSWRDIAVLVPIRTGGDDLYGAMQEAGIPAVRSGGKTFYARQEVMDTVHLLACVADPTDRGALLAFLGSPGGGVDNDGLVALCAAGLNDTFTYLDVAAYEPPSCHPGLQLIHGDERVRVAGVFSDLARLHRCLREWETWDAFREIRRCIPLVEAWSFSRWRSQRMANVDKVMDEIESRVRAGSSVTTVVRELTRSELVEREGEEGVLASPRLDAVTIETIHGAKGLEYPVVLLANLFRDWNQEAERDVYVARDWTNGIVAVKVAHLRNHAARSHHRSREAKREAERARLMYVGLTRAKERLVLFLHPSAAARSYSGILLHALDEALAAGELVEGHELRLIDGGAVPPHSAPPPRPSLAVPEDALARVQNRKRVMDDLAHAPIRLAPSSADEPYLRRELPAQDREDVPEVRDRALRFGDLCHAALQHIDLTRPLEDVEGVLASPLARRVAGDLYGDLLAEARGVLEEAVRAPFFRDVIARADGVVRELPVLESVEGATLSGRIDLAVRTGGTWAVIDFKTDRDLASHGELRERYGGQMRAYTRALRRALNLPEDPRFFLYFLRHCVAVEL